MLLIDCRSNTGERTALAQIRASKSPQPGTTIRLADAFDVTLGERVEPFYTLLVFADILVVLLSMRYSASYQVVFRNSGLAVATMVWTPLRTTILLPTVTSGLSRLTSVTGTGACAATVSG